ncbi:NADP-dependent D-sorbitol-6-phosphate dehydrogenase-like [Populus alba x Populus x berolinensis]|nr:NADP-dependent D-sorbitol-6-phosphate dehydrogenase-like [Populus alba x Populus x berolinensis]
MAITLNNGFQMLIIVLGLWRMEGKETRNLIINPIKLGYRQFDCVADHKSEAIIGEVLAEAFKTGLAKREDLFITTKV